MLHQKSGVKYIKDTPLKSESLRTSRKRQKSKIHISLDNDQMTRDRLAQNSEMAGLRSRNSKLDKGQYPYVTVYNPPKDYISLKKKYRLRLRMMEREGNLDEQTDARMLFSAIRRGKIRLAKFILDAAPQEIANATDIRGKSPLIIACFMKEELLRDSMVSLLLNFNSNVNSVDDDGRTALSYACEKRCNRVVKTLVQQATIEPDIADKKGNTALIYSAKVGNDVAIDILTRRFRRLGLAVDHINKDGLTALLTAAKNGFITCTKLLIEYGHASILHRDLEGYSAQEWLLRNGFTWDDIISLTEKSRSRAKFVKAIQVARMSNVSSWSKKKHSSSSLAASNGQSDASNPASRSLHQHSGRKDHSDDHHKSKVMIDAVGDAHNTNDEKKSGKDKPTEHRRIENVHHASDGGSRKTSVDRLQLPKIQVTGMEQYTKTYRDETAATSESSAESESDDDDNDDDQDVFQSVMIDDIDDPESTLQYRSRFRNTKSQKTVEEYLSDDNCVRKDKDY